MTNFNVKKDNLDGENTITGEHVKNNTKVRGILVEGGIVPEELPAEEDIQKLQRKVKNDSLGIADDARRKEQKRLMR